MMNNQAEHSPNYKKTQCCNCKRFFLRKVAGSNRKLPNGIRGRNAVNCSSKCTKEWRDKMDGRGLRNNG